MQDDGVIDLSSYNFWVEDVKSGNRVDDLTIYDLYLKKISTLLKKSNILIKV